MLPQTELPPQSSFSTYVIGLCRTNRKLRPTSATCIAILSLSLDRKVLYLPFTGGESLILRHATHSVYILWASYRIRDTSVRGVVTDRTLRGRLAAQMARPIRQGGKTEQILVLDHVGHQPMFEYGTLLKNDITLLPRNSIISTSPNCFIIVITHISGRH